MPAQPQRSGQWCLQDGELWDCEYLGLGRCQCSLKILQHFLHFGANFYYGLKNPVCNSFPSETGLDVKNSCAQLRQGMLEILITNLGMDPGHRSTEQNHETDPGNGWMLNFGWYRH